MNGLPMVLAPGTTAALPVAATGPAIRISIRALRRRHLAEGVSLKRRVSSCAHALSARSRCGKQQYNCRIFIGVLLGDHRSHRFPRGCEPAAARRQGNSSSRDRCPHKKPR